MATGAGGTVVSPPGVVAGDPATTVASIDRTLELPLPDVYPLPDAVQFNVSGAKTSVGAESNVPIPGAVIVIPDNMLCRLALLNIDLDNMLTTTVVSFSVLANMNPIAGFSALTPFARVAPSIGQEFDMFVRLSGPLTIQVVYTNSDGGTYPVGASLSGWYWPVASDVRWKARGA